MGSTPQSSRPRRPNNDLPEEMKAMSKPIIVTTLDHTHEAIHLPMH